MKHKILSLVLCISMLMSVFTIGAYAEDEIDWDQYLPDPNSYHGNVTDTIIWDYNPTTRVFTLSGTGPMPDYTGHTDHPWIDHRSSVRKIVIGEGITYIGSYNFSRFDSATEIIFPSTVEGFGELVFHRSYNLANITFPPMETIPSNNLFLSAKPVNIIIPEGVKEIADGAFSSCSTLETISLPNSLERIGSAAFMGCKSLKSVVIPEGVKKIEDLTFHGCYALESITLPEGIDLNSWAAFSACNKLCDENGFAVLNDALVNYSITDEELIIPDGVKYVGCLFRGDYGQAVTHKKIVFPDSVEEIADLAFFNNSNVEEIVLSNNIKKITDSTFASCSNLRVINLPTNLETLGKNAFANCTKLESITIPEGVAELCEGAFENCAELKEITIGKSVEKIELNVFSECMNLTKVHYMGNEKQWSNIDVADGNDVLLTADITFEELLKLLGDVDGDGEITAADALLLRKFCAGILTLEDINIEFADAFEDGKINAKDLLVIKKLLSA